MNKRLIVTDHQMTTAIIINITETTNSHNIISLEITATQCDKTIVNVFLER